MTVAAGIFFILHGLVHLLYVGQSLRWFELRPGFQWPDGSWAFSRVLGDPAARRLAALALVLAALGFIQAGLGLFLQIDGWNTVVVSAAVFSTIVYLLFWDGKFQDWPARGGIGIILNALIVLAVVVLKWPF